MRLARPSERLVSVRMSPIPGGLRTPSGAEKRSSVKSRKNVREVIWMMNAAADEIVYVNPAYEQIWGRSCESLYQNPMSWFDAIRPDDQQRAKSVFEQQMQGNHT